MKIKRFEGWIDKEVLSQLLNGKRTADFPIYISETKYVKSKKEFLEEAVFTVTKK